MPCLLGRPQRSAQHLVLDVGSSRLLLKAHPKRYLLAGCHHTTNLFVCLSAWRYSLQLNFAANIKVNIDETAAQFNKYAYILCFLSVYLPTLPAFSLLFPVSFFWFLCAQDRTFATGKLGAWRWPCPVYAHEMDFLALLRSDSLVLIICIILRQER